ncbi:hypothetical protein H4O14_02360 [Bacillus sp. PAMC26568]|nr:hypothetical protein H4O14_02360 [Bacillus sp. PAMC26568]
MNVLILNALSNVGVPVAFQSYRGKSKTYITFFIAGEGPALHADNKEVKTWYLIQVDIWSKTDYTNLAKTVKEKMKLAGFRRSSSQDLYENDTEIYHKAMRFYYSSTPE